MNSTKTSVRNELFSQANLVSAIRLPNNLFTDNAGTEVGSDLIVLQKNLSKKEMSQDERLMTVIQTDTKTDLTDNAYFSVSPLTEPIDLQLLHNLNLPNYNSYFILPI